MRSPAQREPELFPGAIHGLRSWSLRTDGSLGAVAKPFTWPAAEAVRAVCLESVEHEAPAPGCGCGLYAYHLSSSRAQRLQRQRHTSWSRGRRLVIGIVEAWGRVEVHVDGFRAEWARPKALVSFGDDPRSRYSSARRAAEKHELELVCVRDPADLLRTMRARGWAGLDPNRVEELVIAGSEVVLAPGADGFLDRFDEPIGGYGFHILVSATPLAQQVRPEAQLPGTIVTKVSRTEEFSGLRDRGFDPGRRVKLVREDNLRRGCTIGIWDEHERVQVGYLPHLHSRRVRRLLAAGKFIDARVIWQWRRLRSGERSGLQLLISRCPVRLATAEELKADDEDPF